MPLAAVARRLGVKSQRKRPGVVCLCLDQVYGESTPQLSHPQTRVLLLPRVERRFANDHLPTDVGYRGADSAVRKQ